MRSQRNSKGLWKIWVFILFILFAFYSCNEDEVDECYRCCTDYEYYQNNPDYCYDKCGTFDDCGSKCED